MPSKGRPPPPPKPEELIDILDKKFEEYKVEKVCSRKNIYENETKIYVAFMLSLIFIYLTN